MSSEGCPRAQSTVIALAFLHARLTPMRTFDRQKDGAAAASLLHQNCLRKLARQTLPRGSI
jgi:hypothetical protein